MIKAMLGGRETIELASVDDVTAALAKADGQALSYLSVRGDGTDATPPGFIQATASKDADKPWVLEIGDRGDLQKTLADSDAVALAIARWAGLVEGDPAEGHEWTEVKI